MQLFVCNRHSNLIRAHNLKRAFQELVLRRRGSGRAPLKVILMSATLDAKAFGDYFGGCPGMSIFALLTEILLGLRFISSLVCVCVCVCVCACVCVRVHACRGNTSMHKTIRIV